MKDKKTTKLNLTNEWAQVNKCGCPLWIRKSDIVGFGQIADDYNFRTGIFLSSGAVIDVGDDIETIAKTLNALCVSEVTPLP